jgi:hypothetical protein
MKSWPIKIQGDPIHNFLKCLESLVPEIVVVSNVPIDFHLVEVSRRRIASAYFQAFQATKYFRQKANTRFNYMPARGRILHATRNTCRQKASSDGDGERFPYLECLRSGRSCRSFPGANSLALPPPADSIKQALDQAHTQKKSQIHRSKSEGFIQK